MDLQEPLGGPESVEMVFWTWLQILFFTLQLRFKQNDELIVRREQLLKTENFLKSRIRTHILTYLTYLNLRNITGTRLDANPIHNLHLQILFLSVFLA